MINFEYVYPLDALDVDGNGQVLACQASLVGTCSETGYEFSITVRNTSCCELPHRDGYVEIDDIDENDCDCWLNDRICTNPLNGKDFNRRGGEQPPPGYKCARDFYEEHITKMIARDCAEWAELEAMTDEERGALQTGTAPRKSFMMAAPGK